ncbi:MAG: carbohydrate-binding family 9-like protein, partial [Pedosphaera parvula]|nr:carbohydrate-binding family 9-like protein [Pedosphaera parvula]
MIFPVKRTCLAAVLSLVVLSAEAQKVRRDHQPTLAVPFAASDLTLDGQLSESCYRESVPVESVWVAGKPDRKPPRTRAWLFWNDERLLCAFDCEDAGLVAAPKSASESDVDGQDRVELFLWSGRERDAYYCVEIGALGALHDYRAPFYRQFDSAWALDGLRYAVARTATGYSVEAEIPRAAMEQMGFRPKPRAKLRGGLFRADFSASDPKAEPAWITWVDARESKPDFHVAASFGELVPAPESATPAESTFHITETETQLKLASDTLEAAVNKRGYVTGIAAGSFLDKKTGFRDAGYGLDIVDWIMEPGSDALYRQLLKGDLPYDFNNAYHGKRAKH